jgi:vacuolar-type H+-ATPase subunit I/STV1
MREKLIALLEKHANVSDELLEIEKEIENLKDEIGETQATEILMGWLNSEVAEA